MAYLSDIFIQITTIATGVLITIGWLSPQAELVENLQPTTTPVTISVPSTWEAEQQVQAPTPVPVSFQDKPPVVIVPVYITQPPFSNVPIVEEPTPVGGTVAEVPVAPIKECAPFKWNAVRSPHFVVGQNTFGWKNTFNKYTIKVEIEGECKDWLIDYEYDAWAWENDGNPIVVRETVRNVKAGSFQFMHPVAGTHSATFWAHSTDNSTSTSPIRVEFEGGLTCVTSCGD